VLCVKRCPCSIASINCADSWTCDTRIRVPARAGLGQLDRQLGIEKPVKWRGPSERPAARTGRACALGRALDGLRMAGSSRSPREVRVQPICGAGRPAPAQAAPPSRAAAPAPMRATRRSSTDEANRPTSSSVSEFTLTARTRQPRADGLYPITPQNEAGRITERQFAFRAPAAPSRRHPRRPNRWTIRRACARAHADCESVPARKSRAPP